MSEPDAHTRQSPLPPLPALLSAVLVLALAWYLAQVLGGYNGDVVTFQRYFDRFAAGVSLPFEYPPAAVLVFALAAVPHLAWPVPAFAAWMAIPVLGGYLACWRFRGPRAAFAYLALLATGAIATVLTRYDILPALLTLAALWAAQRERWTAAHLLLVLGGLLKLYPLVLVPVFLAAQWRGSGSLAAPARSALPGGLLLVAGIAIPLLLWGPASLEFLTKFAVQRPAELASTPAVVGWALGGGHTVVAFGQVGFAGPAVPALTALCAVAFGAVYAAVLARTAMGGLAVGPATVLTIAALLAFNKAFSPQYLLWLLPLVASEEGATPAWLGVAALTTLAYPLLWPAAATAPPVLMLTLLARDLLLSGIVLGRTGAGRVADAARSVLQRAGWRRLLAVAAGLVFAEVLLADAAALAITALGTLHGPDFLAYFTAAQIVASGRGAMQYQVGVQTAVQHAITAGWGPNRLLLAWVGPPQLGLLVAPLAALSYRVAYVTWLLVEVLAMVAAVALLVRAEGFRRWSAWLVAAGALAMLPVLVTLLQGQPDGLCLVGLAILRADWRRPTWRSAVGAALVLFKPHLFAVVLLLMLARRSSAIALAAGAAVSAVVPAVAFGPGIWIDWGRLVVPTASGAAEGWATGHEDRLALGGQLELLGVPAVWATLLLVLAILAVFALLVRRREQPAALAVAVTASVLFSPHVNAHDLVLLLLPAIAVVGWLRDRADLAAGVALALAALSVDAMLFISPGLVVAGVAALGWAAWRTGLVSNRHSSPEPFVSRPLVAPHANR